MFLSVVSNLRLLRKNLYFSRRLDVQMNIIESHSSRDWFFCQSLLFSSSSSARRSSSSDSCFINLKFWILFKIKKGGKIWKFSRATFLLFSFESKSLESMKRLDKIKISIRIRFICTRGGYRRADKCKSIRIRRQVSLMNRVRICFGYFDVWRGNGRG